jgi:hypothetical protein
MNDKINVPWAPLVDFDQEYQWKYSVVVVIFLYICCIVLSLANRYGYGEKRYEGIKPSVDLAKTKQWFASKCVWLAA